MSINISVGDDVPAEYTFSVGEKFRATRNVRAHKIPGDSDTIKEGEEIEISALLPMGAPPLTTSHAYYKKAGNENVPEVRGSRLAGAPGSTYFVQRRLQQYDGLRKIADTFSRVSPAPEPDPRGGGAKRKKRRKSKRRKSKKKRTRKSYRR